MVHQPDSKCGLKVPAGLVQTLQSLGECIWCTPEVEHQTLFSAKEI